MDKINIKVHPPWYARGTPVIKIRDGPAMALNDNLLFAICRGPSARGKPGECRNAGMRECMNEDGRRKTEVGSRKPEDQRRVKPRGIICLWLTLKTTFFNTQNSVYGQWYAVLGRKLVVGVSIFDADRSEDAVRSGEAAVDFDLSACGAPDNVKILMRIDNVKLKMEMVDFDFSIVDADRSIDAVRSGEADLSACVAPDNVELEEDIVEMKMVFTDSFVVDADRSIDAVRSGGTVDFDLSAYEASRWIGTGSDNVKMMEDVKMKMEYNVKKKEMKIELFNNKF